VGLADTRFKTLLNERYSPPLLYATLPFTLDYSSSKIDRKGFGALTGPAEV
jgi:hypothetical protein